VSRELLLRLKLIKYRFWTKQVRVMVVKDSRSLRVDGDEITLQKGVEIETPLWLAKILARNNIVNIIETSITIEDIARVHFSVVSARTPADLEPLPRNFYLEATRYIEQLEETIRKEFKAELLEEKQKAIQYLLEIIDKRLLLILQSMRSPTAIAEISSKLSEEEAILLNELKKDIELWRRNIVPIQVM